MVAFAHGELYRRYHGLDNAVVGARADIRHKFGVGYQAPWLRIAPEGSQDDYDDALRDSNRLLLDAEFGVRYNEALDFSAGISYDRRYDNHSESLVPGIPGTVFDLRGFAGYARAGYVFNDIVYGALRLGVRRGDVESTAQQSLPIFLASSAITVDPVFGSDDLFAYRLRGTTWSGSTTASFALDSRASLNLSYVDEHTYGAYGTHDGKALIADLPPRAHIVRVWHPEHVDTEEKTRKDVDTSHSARAEVAWELRLKPEVKIRRAPVGERGGRY